jgi:hypothetical protein
MRFSEPPALDDETRALIAAARGAHEPSEISRARVRRGVEVKLAAGLGLALAPASTALAGATKVTLVVAALGTAVGTGVYTMKTREPKPAPVVAKPRPVAAARPVVPPPVEKPAPAASAPAPAPRRRAYAVAPTPEVSASALAAETALLGAANTALAHRDVKSAIALLQDYDRRGGPGVLAEERTVTGVLVSCAAGRPDAARAEARHFRARWPRSPLAARVDGSCVGSERNTR